MYLKKIIPFLLLFLFPNLVFTQENKTSFSLDEAKKYALEYAYDIKSADFDLKSAKKKVWETIAIGLPQLSATANYNDALDVTTQLIPDFITPIVYEINEDKFGLTPNAPQPQTQFFPAQFGQQYSSNVTFSVSQLIFDGTYIVGTQAVKVYLQLSKDKKEKTEIEIKDLVTSSYYNVLVAEENYNILKKSYENNEKLLKEIKAFYENGFREETDLLQMQLITNRSKNSLSDAKRMIETNRLLLKYIMGMDIESEITLTNTLNEFVDDALTIQAPPQATSVSEHVDFRVVETQLKAQKLLLKKEKAAYLPTLSAFYNYQRDAFGDEWDVHHNEWFKSSMIGLNLSLPIFKSGMQSAKVAQEKFAFKKVENQLFQIEQNLKRNKIETYYNLLNVQEEFENVKQNLELSEIIFNRTTIKFNEGISNSAELSQIEQQYYTSLSNYIGSILQLLNTKKSYLKATSNL